MKSWTEMRKENYRFSEMIAQLIESSELRPIHETIIEAIKNCRGLEGFKLLAILVKITKIPKGHDEIIEAFKFWKNSMFCDDKKFEFIKNDLLKQKEEVQKKRKIEG